MGWPFVSSELAFVCLHFSHWKLVFSSLDRHDFSVVLSYEVKV